MLAEVRYHAKLLCPDASEAERLPANVSKWERSNYPNLSHFQGVFLCRRALAPVENVTYEHEGDRGWVERVPLSVENDHDRPSDFGVCFAVLQKRTFTLMHQTLRHYRATVDRPRFYAYMPEIVQSELTGLGLDASVTLLTWKQVLLSGNGRTKSSAGYGIRQQGQYLAYNDFLNRFRARHPWMVFVDADDWLVPSHPGRLLLRRKDLRDSVCAYHVEWRRYSVSSVDPCNMTLGGPRGASPLKYDEFLATKNVANSRLALVVSIHKTE